MDIPDRRAAFSDAMLVEKGIWLAAHRGFTSAFDYLREHGIPDGVAARVLTGPEFQRNSGERRKGGRRS